MSDSEIKDGVILHKKDESVEGDMDVKAAAGFLETLAAAGLPPEALEEIVEKIRRMGVIHSKQMMGQELTAEDRAFMDEGAGKFCNECGADIAWDAKTCTECGTENVPL